MTCELLKMAKLSNYHHTRTLTCMVQVFSQPAFGADEIIFPSTGKREKEVKPINNMTAEQGRWKNGYINQQDMLTSWLVFEPELTVPCCEDRCKVGKII